MTTWLKHVEDWKDCQRCPLAKQRDRICLARGTMPCDVLFIGEAPGMSEDAMGLPFKGPAGDLLDQIIARALPQGTTCLLTNLVACYPREAKERGDNEPERGEIMGCRPRLVELANLCQPKLVVTVGGLAENYVKPICTGPHVSIVHPAHILARMPAAQKGFAVNKCVAQISCALEELTKTKPQKFEKWSTGNAQVKSKRQHLRNLYDEAASARNLDDDLPF